MKLTVMAGDDRFLEVEVDAGEVVEAVKALIEVETGVPVQNQLLLFEGKTLANHMPLGSCGVKDSDMLLMMNESQARGTGPGAPGAGAPSAHARAEQAMALAEDGAARDPAAFRDALLADKLLLARLAEINPPLVSAVEANNLELMQASLRKQRELVRVEQQKKKEEEELLLADPFDPRAQAKIEERIRQENIDLNYEVALEHSPEQFVAVHMLFVPMKVNNHAIKAFVDSGAQSTIMSLGMAEKCDLMRLVDKRFSGTAVGVGTSKIVGIIHAVPLQIGPNYYSCRITVLEKLGSDFLFGLDMLKRHQCCIDLKTNVLSVGGGEITVPFLQEKDCPSRALEGPDLEPALDAPEAGLGALAGPSTAQAGTSAAGTTAGGPQPGPIRTPLHQGSFGGHPPQGNNSLSEKVAKLVELGFTAQQAQEALELANGNAEQAAGILFQGL